MSDIKKIKDEFLHKLNADLNIESINKIKSELFGKKTGCSKGRGGSMHLFKPEIGLMGTSGIVGPNILQSCGAGYSINLFKRNNVSISFFDLLPSIAPVFADASKSLPVFN